MLWPQLSSGATILGIDSMTLETTCRIGMTILTTTGDIPHTGGITTEDRGEDGINGDGGAAITDHTTITGPAVTMDTTKVTTLDIVTMGS